MARWRPRHTLNVGQWRIGVRMAARELPASSRSTEPPRRLRFAWKWRWRQLPRFFARLMLECAWMAVFGAFVEFVLSWAERGLLALWARPDSPARSASVCTITPVWRSVIRIALAALAAAAVQADRPLDRPREGGALGAGPPRRASLGPVDGGMTDVPSAPSYRSLPRCW